MEKRRLISLRSVLLQYLVRTALACLLVAVGWLLVLMLWIQNGELFLPANQAAQACQKAAQDVLPGMTAATFDETQLDSLCRYALFAAPDSSEVLATNMDAGHLQRAMENQQGKTRWHFGYTQYYMTSKLQDGTVCLLQFDYAVPYADPALRGVLPDMQTVHCILGILLLVGAVVWSTHRTGRFLTRETEKLTAAAQAVARKDLDSAVFSGAKVREYESALQALQTMGDELTGSLQKQWDMEQRQREQIIQLSHKLKTPLTIIEGNAELLAEDALTPEQREQVQAMTAAFLREFGRIDVLVCNAGIARQELFTDITEASWREVMGVDLDGVFYCAQAVLPDMLHRKAGKIITLSSMWGQVGASCEVAYSTAKAGVIGLTKALAKELGPSGITVNCVAPGVIDTEMNGNLPQDIKDELAEETPLERLGTPEDVAQAVWFLASSAGDFFTGQILAPNGGLII